MTEPTTLPLKKLPEWRLLKFDEKNISMITEHFACSNYMARSLLFNEVDTIEKVEQFLNPKVESWLEETPFPSLISGAEKVAELIKQNKRICVHGDFDTDGIFSTVVLMMFLEACGADCFPYIPKRSEGHGLSLLSAEKVKEMGAEVVITVDCGVNAIQEAIELKKNNIELVITDHHLPDENLPDALAIINPQLDPIEEYKVLSGAGVSYRLGIQMSKLLPPSMINNTKLIKFIENGLICAAIATIADVVPLTGYNRSLVAIALKKISEVKLIGLKKLLQIAGIKGEVASEDLAFQFIPRLNAAQRMQKEGLVWELLNSKEEAHSNEICKELNNLNNDRKVLQKKHYTDVLKMCLEKFKEMGVPDAVIVFGDAWTEGISGLIASNLVEYYHRPVCVILKKENEGLASCRAPEGFHLKNALDACSDLLISGGGHAGAAGFKIALENEDTFTKKMQSIMKIQRENMDIQAQNPKLFIVSEVPLPVLNLQFVEEIKRLEPFGKNNPKPLFAMRGVIIDGNVKYIGADKSHVIISFFKQGQNSVGSIGFSMADQLKEMDHFGRFDIVFTVGISKFNKKIQLQLKAVRQSEKK